MDSKLRKLKFSKRRKAWKRSMSKCNHKVSHSSKEHALIAISNMLKQSKINGYPIVTTLNAYQCTKCGSWHVGKNKRKINWDYLKTL